MDPAPRSLTVVLSRRDSNGATVGEQANGHRAWLIFMDGFPDGVAGNAPPWPHLRDPAIIDAYQEPEPRRGQSSVSKGRSSVSSAVLSPLRLWLDRNAASVIGLRTSHNRLVRYRSVLFTSLRDAGLVEPADGDQVKLHVTERLREDGHGSGPGRHSLHCLSWEILEPGQDKDWCYDIQVHRVLLAHNDPQELGLGLRRADRRIRILAVIARRFPTGASLHAPEEPLSSVYGSLCSLLRYLRQIGRGDRLEVHVIRPGTLGELEAFLVGCKSTEVAYDIIHIDLHGKIDRGTPKLGFASRTGDGSLEYETAAKVAKVVQEHKIAVVALSACLSSHGHLGPTGDMCHVFATEGRVRAVTGMTVKVDRTDVEAYYTAFYGALVLAGRSFREASAAARVNALQVMKERHAAREKELIEQRKRRILARDADPADYNGDPLPDRRDWPFAAAYVVGKAPPDEGDNLAAAAARVTVRTDSVALGVSILPAPYIARSSFGSWMQAAGRWLSWTTPSRPPSAVAAAAAAAASENDVGPPVQPSIA